MPAGRFDDDRDRTVPPEEDYYGRAPIDLDFNSKGRGGINPVDEYNKSQNTAAGQGRARRSERQAQSSAPRRTAQAQYGREDLRSPSSAGRQPAPARAKKKSSPAPKIAAAVIAVILVIALICTALVEGVLGKINYDEKKTNSYVSASELQSSPKVKNILLLGVDARPDDESEASRADSMMLITLDREHGCIKLTSFLRDSWVYIPVKDKMQRLNAACTYGGYPGVVDTIEYNFGVEIDGYVVADFEMFKIMVDSIGGVEVEVSEKEAKEVTNHPGRYGNVKLDAGTYKLTGEQALAYCRIRKIDTDWKRTERQRTVIQAIIKGVLASGPVGAYKAASGVAPYIQTDLSKGEIRQLALSALMCVGGGFDQRSCPFEGTWEYATHSGASVIDLDTDENSRLLADYIYNADKPEEQTQSEDGE